jgi:hypothetical protein
MFEIRMLRTFGSKKKEAQEAGENCIMRMLIVIANVIKDDQIKEYEIDRECKTHSRDACRKLWQQILKQRTILKT